MNLNRAIEDASAALCNAGDLRQLSAVGKKLDEECRFRAAELGSRETLEALRNFFDTHDKIDKQFRVRSGVKSDWPAIPVRYDRHPNRFSTLNKIRRHLSPYPPPVSPPVAVADVPRLRGLTGGLFAGLKSRYKFFKLKAWNGAQLVCIATASHLSRMRGVLMIMALVRWLYEFVDWIICLLP